jgi:hypothetical protein
MRFVLSAGVAALAAAVTAAPAQAQGGEFMWCVAWTDTETVADKSYYSAFFAAGAWEADRKAFAFKNFAAKSAVGDTQASPLALKASCMAPAGLDAATASRNVAMKAAPGTVLSWEGK